MADRFHVNCDLAPGPVVISGPEAHHIAHVLRARPGDPVCLFNGDGRQYPARVTHAARREVTLDVLQVETPPRARVTDADEGAAVLPEGAARRRDYLEGFLKQQPAAVSPAEPGGDARTLHGLRRVKAQSLGGHARGDRTALAEGASGEGLAHLCHPERSEGPFLLL